jgi:hypothetical protein
VLGVLSCDFIDGGFLEPIHVCVTVRAEEPFDCASVILVLYAWSWVLGFFCCCWGIIMLDGRVVVRLAVELETDVFLFTGESAVIFLTLAAFFNFEVTEGESTISFLLLEFSALFPFCLDFAFEDAVSAIKEDW